MKNRIFFSGLFFLCLTAFSCKSQLGLKLTGEDEIQITFATEFGKNIRSMVESAGGSFDDVKTEEIQAYFEANGFYDVKAAKTEDSFSLKMLSKITNPEILESKVISVENKKITVNLTPESFKDFYTTTDENISSLLDLFLAPVFNNEQMSQDEYEEMIASVYGQDFADELNESSLTIAIKNGDGAAKEKIIPYSRLFTLNEQVQIKAE